MLDKGAAAVPGAQRAQLVLPLLQLVPAQPVVPRTLDLEQSSVAGRSGWASQVRESLESCLLVDAAGRVAAASLTGAAMLGADPVRCVGALLLDLVTVVDFTETGVPLPEPEMAVPPLRALRSGHLARALVRLRLPSGVVPTYDVVGVPVEEGALAFLSEV